MYEFLRRNVEHQWTAKKQSCGPLAFYARRTQGLNRIFGLAFFIGRKDLRCDPGKATLITPRNWGMCLNIVFDLVNVKYKIKYADDVFCKQRLDKANAQEGRLTARIREYYNRKK
jgi:hypothetical protein